MLVLGLGGAGLLLSRDENKADLATETSAVSAAPGTCTMLPPPEAAEADSPPSAEGSERALRMPTYEAPLAEALGERFGGFYIDGSRDDILVVRIVQPESSDGELVGNIIPNADPFVIEPADFSTSELRRQQEDLRGIYETLQQEGWAFRVTGPVIDDLSEPWRVHVQIEDPTGNRCQEDLDAFQQRLLELNPTLAGVEVHFAQGDLSDLTG